MFAKILTTLGIIFNSIEHTIVGKSSGGHDSLRTIADKLNARMFNEVKKMTPVMIDVGSKYMLFNKLCDMRGWHVDVTANPADFNRILASPHKCIGSDDAQAIKGQFFALL